MKSSAGYFPGYPPFSAGKYAGGFACQAFLYATWPLQRKQN